MQRGNYRAFFKIFKKGRVAIATKFLTGSTRFYLDLYGYKVSFDSDK